MQHCVRSKVASPERSRTYRSSAHRLFAERYRRMASTGSLTLATGFLKAMPWPPGFEPGRRIRSRLRPAGGGGENRTRVRSSVPQELYERSPGFDLTLASPMGPDPPEPVAVKSPPGGRDARRKRVSGVYAGDRSC